MSGTLQFSKAPRNLQHLVAVEDSKSQGCVAQWWNDRQNFIADSVPAVIYVGGRAVSRPPYHAPIQATVAEIR